MRTKNVSRNVVLTIISKIVLLVIGFISRKLIIQFISIEFLGLNSLYSNLLDLLNLAELGLGVAIQIRLYEPLVKNDYNKVAYILSIAKKIYTFIGIFVLVIGSLSSFLLRFIIKDSPFELWYVQVAYIISVVGISASYLCADKRLFFESNEKYYLITIADLLVRLLSFIVGITLLYFTREYLIYCSIIAVQTFISNFILYLIFVRKYSIYKIYDKSLFKDSIEKTAIKHNMFDVIPMKLGAFIFSSTDSIVISSFLGLTFVALYSNYNLLFLNLLSLSTIISTALVSTFGKIEKENPDRENLFKKYSIYNNLQFMFSSFSTVCIFLLIDKFIYLWLGEGYTISMWCVILLSADYFIHSSFQPLSTLYTSTGKFKQDKICTLIAAGLNIILSIILVNFIGLEGIIIGTLSANIFTYIVRTIVIENKYFHQNLIKRFGIIGLKILVVIAEVFVCYFAIKYINIQNKWLDFLTCGIICAIIPLCIDGIIAWKLGYWDIGKRMLKNFRKTE